MPLRTCKKYNSTAISIPLPEGNPYFRYTSSKRFEGIMSNLIMEFAGLKRKKENQDDFLKYCQFKVAKEDGYLLENGSYTGALGLLQSNKADFYLRPHNLEMFNEIDISNVYATDSIVISHLIYNKEEQLDENFSFNEIKGIFMPSIGFFFFYTLLLLMSIMIGLFFYYTINRSKKNLSFSNCLKSLLRLNNNLNHLPNYLKFIILFNLLFLFWIKQFLSVNIKTSKVIVDKSQLLYNDDVIRATKLQGCFVEISKETDLFHKARKETIVYDIDKKAMKKNGDYCTALDENNSVKKIDENFFLISATFQSNFVLKLLSMGRQEIFENPKQFFQINAVILMSKNADQKIKDEIYKWAYDQIEFGYSLVFFKFFNLIINKDTQINSRIYESVNSFIDDNTIVHSNYEFDKFKSLFYFYILIILILNFIPIAFILFSKILIIIKHF